MWESFLGMGELDHQYAASPRRHRAKVGIRRLPAVDMMPKPMPMAPRTVARVRKLAMVLLCAIAIPPKTMPEALKTNMHTGISADGHPIHQLDRIWL